MDSESWKTSNAFEKNNQRQMSEEITRNQFKKEKNADDKQTSQQDKQKQINDEFQTEYQQDVVGLLNNTQQAICRKYPKVTILVIIVCCIIIGGLAISFRSRNNQSQDRKNIDIPEHDKNKVEYDNFEHYDLVKLNSTSALCLDGTPGSYYISRSGDPSKIYLYFEGGGWCADSSYQATLKSCSQRSQTFMGSSNYSSPQMGYREGILSRNEKNYFKDWKKVQLRYCDGMGHQGTRKQPIAYNGTLLYFRGHNITVEQFQSLQQKIGLFSKASQIVVSGQSAGGLASFMWVNYIADKAKTAKVFGFPGSGVFLDSFNNWSKTYFIRQVYQGVVEIANQQIDPPMPQCVKEFPNNKEKCFFAQYFYQHIKVPIFVVQSLYDSWCIRVLLGINCNNTFQSVKNCNSDEMKIILQYRTNTSNLLQEIAQNKSHGVWGVACSVHNLLALQKFYNQDYRIPLHSSNSINEAFKNWIQNSTSTHNSVDTVHWPGNYPCSGLKLS